MRPALLRFTAIYFSVLFLAQRLGAQNTGFSTGLNNTVINLACNQNCVTQAFQIPHLKSTGDYVVTTIPYNPYPYTTPAGTEDPSLYNDDRYSFLINIPFSFCFYDMVFNNAVVGSNGLMTFDAANAGCANAYTISQPIPYAGGTICQQMSTYYPKAAIMGAYTDLDPTLAAGPADRKIEWRTEGTAPYRRFIASYYHVGVFGPSNACSLATPNTFQIVCYESTGIIEIFVEQKACTPAGSGGGRAIMGVQNWNRDLAVAAPGKNNTVWSEAHTAYRFTPSGNTSRYVSCELLKLDGTLITPGDSTTTTAGLLDVHFPNFCPTAATGQYIIRTTYSACDNPAQLLVLMDTITVNKTTSLNATLATTQTACGAAGSGTATVTIPAGVGTAPYTFVLNPTGTTQTGASPQQFTGLNAGNYTINVTDASGGCSSSLPVTITSTGTLNVNFNVTNTSCFGNTVANGGISVNQPAGTAPFTYTVNHPTAPVFTNTQTGNGTFNNLTAGDYLLTVQDAGGCQAANLPFTVASGPNITMTYTTSPTTCPGANNASITITGATGTPPYQYFINALPNPSNVFNNLAAPGTYFISLVDAIGCQINFQPIAVVNGTNGVTGTATAVPTTCAGVNDGQISVTPTSGTGPYQYSINNGTTWQAGYVFTGLAPGPYSILIKDGVCVSNQIPVTVAAGNGLQFTLGQTPTTCPAANNGSVTVTATSGTGPYTFVLDGALTQNSATNSVTYNNLPAGSHSVTIKDVNGCINSSPATITVAAGSGFTAGFVATPTGCTGVNNGKLDITVQSPGTAPFTVLLNPGSISQTSVLSTISFTNLSPGTYNALITDANGCQFTLTNMVVNAGAGLAATATSSATTCTGINNGTITVNMTSGAAPYTAIMDGAITQTGAGNQVVFNNVAAGVHNITVTDANGCTTASPVTTTVQTGTGFTATFSPTPTSCAGASNGKLTINPQSPATAPFTVVINPGNITLTSGTPSIQVNNLLAGTYSALITDANGCQYNLANMIVASGSALNAQATPVTTSCNGATNGSVNVQAPTNGTAPYFYSINNGAPQVAPSFGGLAAGTYTIKVTDAGGCSSGNLSVTVDAGPSINVRPDKIDANCFGAATGSISAVPSSNATAPIQYSLDNATWQASPNFTGLAAGTYNVYILDAVGCRNSADTTIGQPVQLLATTSQQDVLCNSGNDGKIVVAAAGGTSPYSYSLDNINFQPVNSFNVAAGTYTVYVRDANGCTIVPLTNVVVGQPALLAASALTGNATCDGGNDGTITVNPAGGVSPYQFALSGGGYQVSNIFHVAPGTYDVTIKDANGCAYPVNGVVVGLTNNLTYTPMLDAAPICESATVNLQLTTNATQFTWDNASSLSNSGIANPVANPGVSTLYTVVATLGRCTITDDVYVPVMPAPVANAGPDGDICYGKTFQLQGSGGVNYSWSPAQYLSSTSVSDPVVTPDQTTTYSLSVTDANGCTSLVPAQVTVKVTPPIKVTTYPGDTVVYGGAQVPLLATSVGTDYVWTSSLGTAGLDNPNIPNPLATAPMIDGSMITYDVKATTSAGCEGHASVTIKVYKGPDLYVPNAFTPNGDGKNDYFFPFPVGIKQLNYFRIFNRWGQPVYSSTTLNQGWDGRLSGQEQPSGVYVWMAQGVTMDNKVISKQGTVTLIR
jgi:gliding motility-associated-like protein